ncbi:uncharacterized protein LOC120255387 [Dioscorea cayenensis subsp. rotundata]|uniref:Uncharacterized protein LOC120255387 n=1 Tax=Dioscorea cayennensis subsp. rotundata TaxID=55577 RepID=A0AB40AVZ4_DIOCR|nr:uncharacterized protein LOC120255387 [Dioscorea cayenensis subsp. rotundata]
MRKCKNGRWQTREVAFDHLACDGILQGYTCWFFHGENVPLSRTSSRNTPSSSSTSHPTTNNTSTGQDGMEELLRDAFNMQHHHDGPTFVGAHPTDGMEDGNETHIGLNEEQPYEEASKFYKLLKDMNGKLYDGSKHSILYFCIRLFHLKCMCGITGKGSDYLIDFLKEFFLMATIPANSRESKKVIKDLGLGYKKIHSCPNDCMLYWEEKEMQQECHVCGASRWLPTESTQPENVEGDQVLHKRPAKVLRYFPLIPRLQRIFMSSKTSTDMSWHANGRTKDGNLRHPADAEAWRSFDARYPDFASDPRNVRLDLSSDGFNPFKLLSTSYSTWPIVLIPYNLPPWIGMKQSSFILSMIIPGEKGPGNDIDVFMQPLIKELKQLWTGVDTYDASLKQNFCMRAALLWPINDFPAYANLSGNLSKSTTSTSRKRLRDGDVDSDDEDLDEDGLHGADLWKKRSIFFDLPYWEHILLRNNLDVMHIEKNICENIVGTILDIDGKSKDNMKSRIDMAEMGIRHELHLEYLPNGRTRLPPASFTMTKREKDMFCQVLKNIKVPDAYSSNISRFLCGKVLDVNELDKLQLRATICLCQLEKILPPSFFTIMVHLLIHLPLEAKLGGPVHYQWVYPIERFLLELKTYVQNKRYPEGSIAEGFLAEECVTFCSR